MNIAVSAPTAAGTPTELPVEVPGPGEAADLRSWLRASLAARHDYLESLPLAARMASGDVGPEDFTRYLLTQLRLMRALEPAIEPWLAPEEARVRLVKRDWIAADLYALGIAPAQLDDLSGPAHPEIRSTAAALGALYVLEGSTLGLAVLDKRMRSTKPDLFNRASRFLTAYGPDSGRMWKQFLATLSGLPRQGWAELRRAQLAPEHMAHLETLESAAHHLASIVNDVLDLSKIEAEKFELDDVPFLLSELLDDVSGLFGTQAWQKGIELRVESVSGVLALRGDPTRLRQCIINYLGNALKFTDKGSIVLRVKQELETTHTQLLRFEVEDTGVGIHEDQLSRIFGAFEQADPSPTKKHGGTGLGLAVTRKLAGLMGGDVGVKSELGVGSTFWFSAVLAKQAPLFGAAPAGDQHKPERDWSRHSGRRVLLVDDETTNCEVACILLEDVGLQVEIAKNGKEAVAAASEDNYAVILMDTQMPVMDGLTATRAIRQLDRHRNTPIVGVTANAMSESKKACLDAGMMSVVLKPIVPELFFDALYQALELSRDTL